jgi:hypothetical protein
MSIERKGIEDRMDRTKKELIQNTQDESKVGNIRRKAMTGIMPNEEEIKWMVRDLQGALVFKGQVLNGWIEGDLIMLKKMDGDEVRVASRDATRIETPLAEAEVETHEITMDEMPSQGLPPEPEVEGADKIKAILEGGNGNPAVSN